MQRETLFEDRTNAHADHVGAGFDRHTTAAVGLLKVGLAGSYIGFAFLFAVILNFLDTRIPALCHRNDEIVLLAV